MREFATSHLASAVLAVALAMPVAALAQTTTAPAAPTTKPMQNAAAPADATADAPEAIRARVEQRIADLHETLHITPAQETRFNEFAQVMLDNAQSFANDRAKHASESAATMTAEESLKDYAQMTEMHARNVQKLSKAFDRLYAGLSAEQKKDADEAFRMAASERMEKKDQKAGG